MRSNPFRKATFATCGLALAACVTEPCPIVARDTYFEATVAPMRAGSPLLTTVPAAFSTSEYGPAQGSRPGHIVGWHLESTNLPASAFLSIETESASHVRISLPNTTAAVNQSLLVEAVPFTAVYDELVAGRGRLVLHSVGLTDTAGLGTIHLAGGGQLIHACID